MGSWRQIGWLGGVNPLAVSSPRHRWRLVTRTLVLGLILAWGREAKTEIPAKRHQTRGGNDLRMFSWVRPRRLLVASIGVVLLLTLVGYSLPSHARLPDTVAVLDASSARLFPLFNTRAGHKAVWTRASERAGAEVIPPPRSYPR